MQLGDNAAAIPDLDVCVTYLEEEEARMAEDEQYMPEIDADVLYAAIIAALPICKRLIMKRLSPILRPVLRMDATRRTRASGVEPAIWIQANTHCTGRLCLLPPGWRGRGK